MADYEYDLRGHQPLTEMARHLQWRLPAPLWVIHAEHDSLCVRAWAAMSVGIPPYFANEEWVRTKALPEYRRRETEGQLQPAHPDELSDAEVSAMIERLTSFLHRLSVATSGITAGTLVPCLMSGECGPEVTPQEFLRFAKRKGWSVPAEMEQHLPEDHAPAYAPATTLPEPVAPPVEPAQTAVPTVGRRGLPAPQAAAVFASLTVGSWDGAGWARAFQDPGTWLVQHRVAPGKKGHEPKPSTWCPMGIARALAEGQAGRQEAVPLKTMHARFTSRPELAPWRDEWDRYFMGREAMTD